MTKFSDFHWHPREETSTTECNRNELRQELVQHTLTYLRKEWAEGRAVAAAQTVHEFAHVHMYILLKSHTVYINLIWIYLNKIVQKAVIFEFLSLFYDFEFLSFSLSLLVIWNYLENIPYHLKRPLLQFLVEELSKLYIRFAVRELRHFYTQQTNYCKCKEKY